MTGACAFGKKISKYVTLADPRLLRQNTDWFPIDLLIANDFRSKVISMRIPPRQLLGMWAPATIFGHFLLSGTIPGKKSIMDNRSTNITTILNVNNCYKEHEYNQDKKINIKYKSNHIKVKECVKNPKVKKPKSTFKNFENSVSFIKYIASFQIIITLLLCCTPYFLQRSTSRLFDSSISPFNMLSNASFPNSKELWTIISTLVLLSNCVYTSAGSRLNSKQHFIPGSCRDKGIWEEVGVRSVGLLGSLEKLCLSAIVSWRDSLDSFFRVKISSMSVMGDMVYVGAYNIWNVIIHDILKFFNSC